MKRESKARKDKKSKRNSLGAGKSYTEKNRTEREENKAREKRVGNEGR